MDDVVIESIARWPNVPAVYGWLSLNARGQWRLHPDGMAIEGGPGQSIANQQILTFINRNYTSVQTPEQTSKTTPQLSAWAFQNGPQRVFVRLDAAPWIIFADDSQGRLTTHTGLAIEAVTHAWIDDVGNLYLQTEHGPGRLTDRDLTRFLEHWISADGHSPSAWWADHPSDRTTLTNTHNRWPACTDQLPLERLAHNQPIDTQLGFVANPRPHAV